MVQDTVVSDQVCPVCHKPMVLKRGRFGQFLGCSDYPQCKTTLRLDKQGNVMPPKPPPQATGIKCYKCKEGELVVRQGKKGPFLGCARFPKCRTIVSFKHLDYLKGLQAAGQWPPATREEADALLAHKSKSTSAVGA
jgi:DNA topoisomerase-1